MPLWLLSILSGAGKLIRKAFDWIADDPWRLFVIVSAVLAVLWWRADARADRLQDALMALREASERVRDADQAAARKRSAERRVGKEWVRRWRFRGWPYP